MRKFLSTLKAVEKPSGSSKSNTKNEEIGEEEEEEGKQWKGERIDLGEGSEVIYMRRLLGFEESWELFNYLDAHIPWTRPTLRVFGRDCLQPRDSCYVASPGLPRLVYSGHTPQSYPWHDFPPLLRILDAVHKAIPGSCFNSLLLNRYKGGNDYVGWHADDEKLYGPTPQIASVSLGCERQFFLKQRRSNPPPRKSPHSRHKPLLNDDDLSSPPPCKRQKQQDHNNNSNITKHQHYSFSLKHGSLLVMRGYTQRDWLHSVPKRANANSTRINLTFRTVFP